MGKDRKGMVNLRGAVLGENQRENWQKQKREQNNNVNCKREKITSKKREPTEGHLARVVWKEDRMSGDTT